MRVFSQGQLGQGLARAVLALFVWSMLSGGIAVLPAGAQVSTRSAVNTQSTAVVPFCNESSFPPANPGGRGGGPRWPPTSSNDSPWTCSTPRKSSPR